MTGDYEYKIGGSLEEDAPSYVVRQADSDLYRGLKSGELCYVFNSRQMGKTSLLVRTMKRLKADGVACAVIDISGLGSQDITLEQWYGSIVDSLLTELNFIEPEDLSAWWDKSIEVSPVRRFGKLIDELLLPNILQDIVIFLDEIDSLLRLDFSADDFLALIRSCYQKRSFKAEYKRLNFALFGVATPSDLIKNEEITPFNIGTAIQLYGFKLNEITPLAKGLEGKVDNLEAVMREVLTWTGGQPFLTQKLCNLLRNEEWKLGRKEWEKKNNYQCEIQNIKTTIEGLVKTRIIDNWEIKDEQEHLKTIRDRIINNEKFAVCLLDFYQQILQQGEITADGTPEQMRLRLTGLVVEQQGKLRVYNQIYANIFDFNWVTKELDKLRPYSNIFNAWVKSKHQNELYLLQGKDLEFARFWADGNSLSNADYKFLSASLERELNQKVTEAEAKKNKALEEENKANLRLTEVEAKTKRQIRIGLIVLTVSIFGAIAALFFASSAEQRLRIATSQFDLTNSELSKAKINIKALINQKNEGQKEVTELIREQQKAKIIQKELESQLKQVDDSFRITSAKLKIANQQFETANKRVEVAKQRFKAANEKVKIAEKQAKNVEEDKQEAEKLAQTARDELQGTKEKLELTRKRQQETERQVRKAQKQEEQAKIDLKTASRRIEQLNTAVVYIQERIGKSRALARNLTNIGEVYNSIGKTQEALKYLNQALTTQRDIRDYTGEGKTLNKIGIIYSYIGESQKALQFYNQALDLQRKTSDRPGEATTLDNIGSVYHAFGGSQKALQFYNQALLLHRAVINRAGEATTLDRIGTVYQALGEQQKALQFYNQALSIRRAVGDRAGEATTLNNIGIIYQTLGETNKALEYFNQALSIRREVIHRAGEATTLNDIGIIYQTLREPNKALEYFNQALSIRREVGHRAAEANSLKNIASVERTRGNLKKALTQIETAININEGLRSNLISQELRNSYFANLQDSYELHIHLLMQLHSQQPSQGYDAQALQANERKLAMGFVELLTEANADIRKGIDPKLLAEERRLQSVIDARTKLLQQPPDNQENKAVRLNHKKELENFLNQYQELQTKIRITSPKYADLKYPQPLKLLEIQQQVLDDNTLFLSYSLGKERSYLWAVNKNSITSYQLPKRAEIEAAASIFHAVLRQESAVDLIQEPGKKLSSMILSPVANQLRQKRLLIAADGILQMIPFAALPIPNNNKKYFTPLIVQNEIVNTPSASSIALLRNQLKKRTPAPKTVAVIADPVFTIQDPRVTGKAEINSSLELELELTRFGWARLPYTRREAEEILRLVPENKRFSAFGFAANYETVTSPEMSKYRIIHFATHSFVDTQNPELSGLSLSLFDSKGNPKAGYLRVHDIFNLNLPAELIVLSACETGLGKEVKGQGLVGLTTGFMYAGSPRVIGSLWLINDMATSVLMTRFYKKMLVDGLKPSAALRAAQLEMWQNTEFKAPYYWAAFTMQGEWR